MVKKNTTVPFSFYCLTEDPTGVECDTIPLDPNLGLEAWWWKICLFKDNLVSGNVNLFFDLDVVIQNNIDDLFLVDGLTLIDFSNKSIDTIVPINSSIMAWKNNTTNHIYENFIEGKDFYLKNYMGLDYYLLYDVGEFSGWSDDVYYSRLKGNYEDPPNDGKVKDGGGSYGVYYYPDKKVCIFNQAHQEKFYGGFDRYF